MNEDINFPTNYSKCYIKQFNMEGYYFIIQYKETNGNWMFIGFNIISHNKIITFHINKITIIMNNIWP